MKSALGALLTDRLMLVSVGFHLVAAVVLTLAAKAPAGAAGNVEPVVHPVLLALTFLVLVASRWKTSDRRERRFWEFLAAAWLCWLAVEFFYFVEVALPVVSASFAADVLYILFYLFLVLSVELKPHLEERARSTGLRRRLESVAGLFAVFGLLIYFGLVNLPEPLGLSLNFVSRDQGLAPYLLVLIVLDLVLTGRFVYAGYTASRRWAVSYLLLAAALLGYAARHTGLLLQELGVPPHTWLWFGWELSVLLPGLLVILAARVRRLPDDTLHDEEAPSSLEREEVFRTNPLALYTLVVPITHFGLYPLGLLDESTRAPREIFSLLYLIMLGALSVFHQLAIERERRQAVAALGQEISKRLRINRELEARQAELEQFSYTISHELKAPLVTIIGFSGLLERGLTSTGDEEARADVGRIRTAATEMRKLLAELLELSRVGWVMERRGQVPITPTVESARDKVTASMLENEPEIVVEQGMPVVMGDAARIEDVFKNLLTNAIKFSQPGRRPKIRVGWRDEPDPVFYVSDNGRGIDARFHDRVFGLFDRVYPDVEGSGVGLALVKRIVDKHGGRVWVESEGEGEGSTFCFTLPRSIDSEAVDPGEAPSEV